jgi:hypothetical protein
MRKIRLELDDLQVETFEVLDEEGGRATVHGHLGHPGQTGAVGVDSCDSAICGNSYCAGPNNPNNTCANSCGSDPCICDDIDP